VDDNQQAESRIDRINQLCTDIDDALASVREMLRRSGIQSPTDTNSQDKRRHARLAPRVSAELRAAGETQSGSQLAATPQSELTS
jgi:hypothetical protein